MYSLFGSYIHVDTKMKVHIDTTSGISDTFSPRTIMTGAALDYENHCQLPFGAYVERHEENSPTNTLSERTQGAVFLGTASNFQGSYTLLCLDTGRKMIRKQFQEVEAITTCDKQSGNMVFTNRDGNPIDNDDDDDDDDTVDAITGTGITGVDIDDNTNENAAMEGELEESV
jgi:hypothetical protein